MQYFASNQNENSTIVEAAQVRSILRRLGLNVGELSVIPMTEGGVVALPIVEEQFAEKGFEAHHPLHLFCEITNWGKCTVLIAGITKCLRVYGLYSGLRYLLANWGCPFPEAHVTNLPGVGAAIQRALAELTMIGAGIDSKGIPTIGRIGQQRESY